MKTTSTKALLAVAVLLASLACTACHKSCTCYSYDGSIREYTADEVEALSTTCDKMISQAGTRYYSYCTWY